MTSEQPDASKWADNLADVIVVTGESTTQPLRPTMVP
jgi:hypothetical protein